MENHPPSLQQFPKTRTGSQSSFESYGTALTNTGGENILNTTRSFKLNNNTNNNNNNRNSKQPLIGLTSNDSAHSLVSASSMKHSTSWSSFNPLFDPSQNPDEGEYFRVTEKQLNKRQTRGDTFDSEDAPTESIETYRSRDNTLTSLGGSESNNNNNNIPSISTQERLLIERGLNAQRSRGNVKLDIVNEEDNNMEKTTSSTTRKTITTMTDSEPSTATSTPRTSNLRRATLSSKEITTSLVVVENPKLTSNNQMTSTKQLQRPSIIENPIPSEEFQNLNAYSTDQPRYIPSSDSIASQGDANWNTSQIWTNMSEEERIKHLRSKRLQSNGKRSSWSIMVEEQKQNIFSVLTRAKSFITSIISPLPNIISESLLGRSSSSNSGGGGGMMATTESNHTISNNTSSTPTHGSFSNHNNTSSSSTSMKDRATLALNGQLAILSALDNIPDHNMEDDDLGQSSYQQQQEHTCKNGQVDSSCVVCARQYVPKIVLELERKRMEGNNVNKSS
jgi:hypothetical protein